jgi:hypothetical protein
MLTPLTLPTLRSLPTLLTLLTLLGISFVYVCVLSIMRGGTPPVIEMEDAMEIEVVGDFKVAVPSLSLDPLKGKFGGHVEGATGEAIMARR